MNGLGELNDEGLEVLLGHWRQRSGGDVMDTKIGLDVDRGRHIGRERSGVHVTERPLAGESRRQLVHVDVQAPAVTGARLGQR